MSDDKLQLKKLLKEVFPVFTQNELVEKIIEKAQLIEIPADTVILDSGNYIKVIPLVFSGNIKVVRKDNDGNEMLLYYIKKGESCAMTLSSCLKREKSSISAVVQTKTQALALPVEVVYDFVHKYPSWNDFIIECYSGRFDEMLEVIDNVCFHHGDERLLKYLDDKSKLLNTKMLLVSHQEIAKDLNTSREVISRLLKQLERKDAVILSRGQIEIVNLF